MDKNGKARTIVGWACLTSWTVSLPGLAAMRDTTGNEVVYALTYLSLFIAVTLTLIYFVYTVRNLSSGDAKDERLTTSFFAKAAAFVIAASLILSTYATIASLWISPFKADYTDRFVFENIATIAGLISIALTFVLSAIQKNIYWTTRKDTAGLDERQLHDRHKVFEKSYKIAALIVAALGWYLFNTLHNIPTIISYHHGTVPGHLAWLPINLAVTLFALPLILATRKSSFKSKEIK